MFNNWELDQLFEKVEEFRDILTVYKNELENIIIKNNL